MMAVLVPCSTARLRSPVQRPEAGRRSPGREAAQIKLRLVLSQAEASFLLEREEAVPVCRLQALRNDAKREGCQIRLHDNKDSGPSEQPSCCLMLPTCHSSITESGCWRPGCQGFLNSKGVSAEQDCSRTIVVRSQLCQQTHHVGASVLPTEPKRSGPGNG